MKTLEEHASFIEEARVVLLTLDETIRSLHSIEENVDNVSKQFQLFLANFEAINRELNHSIDQHIDFENLNKSIRELSIVEQQLKSFKRNHQQLKSELFHTWIAVTFGAIIGFIVGFLFNLLNLTGV